ncbi:MAG: carbohydrate ABC transporter permease [Eubacterium sp.]|jgi:oligogalacturonide transport system permease protein|nr:carbohydrate ABC transporter permease [Eubacterium sp.]HBE10685.1 sugar ABC transporter permease [Lachnospiraceae bacterium]
MPIVSIDNEDDKNTTGSTTSLQGTGATEKVVIKRSSSAQLRAANKKLQRRRRTSTIIRYTVLTVVGLIMIYPLVWMVGATFKENSEIFTSMNPIPLKATFNGYKNAIKSYGGNINIWKAMLNTYSYVVPEVILTVISSVLTAYGFARFKFIGHKVLFAFMMAMLFLPQVVLNIPQYMLFNKFGWVGSNLYLPLIVPTAFAVESYFIFMLIQFLRGVPKEMEEAAQIDGCNSIKTLIKIIIPMILPAIVSCALFKFMWTSNDFIGPLLYVNTPAKYPATIFVKLSMDSDAGFDWNRVLATSLISILPNIIIFFAAQNQFVEGVSAGGVKG